jgi:hypothetical protein
VPPECESQLANESEEKAEKKGLIQKLEELISAPRKKSAYSGNARARRAAEDGEKCERLDEALEEYRKGLEEKAEKWQSVMEGCEDPFNEMHNRQHNLIGETVQAALREFKQVMPSRVCGVCGSLSR